MQSMRGAQDTAAGRAHGKQAAAPDMKAMIQTEPRPQFMANPVLHLFIVLEINLS
jgi:hypothetical protein